MHKLIRRLPRDVAVTLAFVVAAISAAVVPLPADLVERWYSLGMYPRLQRIITPASNLIPIFLIDVGALALIIAGIVSLRSRGRRQGWRRAARSGAFALVIAAAIVYLVFLAMWGLNYRRVPLERKLAYDVSRVTRDTAVQFAGFVAEQINETHG